MSVPASMKVKQRADSRMTTQGKHALLSHFHLVGEGVRGGSWNIAGRRLSRKSKNVPRCKGLHTPPSLQVLNLAP